MPDIDRRPEHPDRDAPSPPATPAAGRAVEVDTAVLMNGRRELTIVHAQERYRLRITANNKLILTK
ncbi:hemin uptake protein HemP [Methylobacterium sp. NEAU 140]|uniref:hemin uptake protein HemP n=1 Tax=Methylobacterium sp. NEAU 140 TaxID=3064945 RepID=UPI002736F0EA|nr:hemin uptake protein HemP [Methylobacterium sp. NEAU 140]MDP4021023.1 hemin uptake protein HemP [Methylobacterium sp. NEAU 140]